MVDGLRNNMKNVIGLIPSRLGSKRLPGKALAKIADIPVIVHVAKRAELSKSLEKVIVCTDSEEILKKVELWGYKAYITDESCSSGSARIASKIKELIYSVWSLKSCKSSEKLI